MSDLARPRIVSFRTIGIIRTPYQTATGTPIQSIYGATFKGDVILDKCFEAALDDIDGFERLWLIYWLDRNSSPQLRVTPYRDTQEHGIFATRSPCRPNPIGMSVVRLLRREGCLLKIADLDMLDKTPLLDIKPYVPTFDVHVPSAAGWFDLNRKDRRLADDRFHNNEER